ncbi:GvpL/GvpF family gas vesicle protein [Cognatiyoonia sp. IB215446]|uniref:GvpL/GvpF family gas vesicle protein n=1 Tax=Cognatiyoonia sp. IB215446 TaxID=3097355 RepID=UPI002A12D248|nr:GvpL/GvpF family gas vesicle protein [Cognatiyoonia sp. IB215446]MDX8348465.1 GvpL/GvpF family gas vesicle protein [Cognatiyoonia sp. IB215446]
MIALGWTAAEKVLPDDVTYHGRGTIRTLAMKERFKVDARSKLRAQVCCFEAGIDLLPIAPSQNLSPAAAQMLLAEADLRDTVMELRGKAQLKLLVQMPKQPKVDQTSGRAWLAARRLHLSIKEQLVLQLSQLARHLALEVAPIRQSECRMQCDMLIPRDKTHEVTEALMRGLDHLPEFDAAKLTVTGPWPPYGFAMIRQTSRQVA